MSVSDYNIDPDLNTSISGINIAEGCAPSGINNAIRQMMADIAAHEADLVHTSGAETVAGNKAFTGNCTAPTQASGNNSTRLATTAFVADAVSGKANDSAVVHNTGAETVAGVKTFSNPIVASIIRNPGTTEYTVVRGGTGTTDGAYLQVYGKNEATNGGNFHLKAHNGTNSASLIGTPAGALQWLSKDVERVHASSFDAQNGYIRYTSGLQIAWGVTATLSAAAAVTFPAAFSVTPLVLLGSNRSVSTYANSVTTTGFNANASAYTNSPAIRYIAVGGWA